MEKMFRSPHLRAFIAAARHTQTMHRNISSMVVPAMGTATNEISCSSTKFSAGGLNSMELDDSKRSVSQGLLCIRDNFRRPMGPSVMGLQRRSKFWCSTVSFDVDNDASNQKEDEDIHDNDFVPKKRESLPQSVDPQRGWNFRGVHKAIICGKVRQTPLQKLLRNGRTLTIFNVGTGGMFDQRTLGAKDLPRPAQWHRIVVHNETLGAYAVRQLVKNSSVYVEGDIEIRVYNKGISREVMKLPEICVRHDGRIRLIKPGESANNINFEELRLDYRCT